MVSILLEEVSKSFGAVRAVDDLSFQIPPGVIWGFLGPNGAGKTTTLRMMMNIIGPDAGRITLLGRPSTEAKLKNRLGYMPEERGLYKKMTAAGVLAYFGELKGLGTGESQRRATEWLERLHLAEAADKKTEALSRGMHQKLQFAVTVINDPDVLILDEPFSGLDPVNLDLIKGVIVQMRDAGKTIIFSTHVMHEAQQLCDHILLINRGRTVLEGTLESIRAQYPSRTISARLEGDTDFIASLAMVDRCALHDHHAEITLREGADAQELLRELVGRVRVRAFEVKTPSLHEIFVQRIGSEHA